MRVLHVAPSISQSYGGPTQSLAGYLAASHVAGIETSIVAPRCDAREAEYFSSRINGGTLNLFPAFGAGAFTTSPSLVGWVARHCGSYDVVHVHGLFNPVSTFSSRRAISRKRAVVIRPFGTLSRYTFEHRRQMLKKVYFRAIERKNVVGAAALHFTTTEERDSAGWHGIDFRDRAYVVPPPWPMPAVNSEPRATASRKVVFLGRIVPVKNVECLIDAWEHVQRAMPDATLDIAGSGDEQYVGQLRDRANRLGDDTRIDFRGFLTGEEKNRLLSSAAVLVLPSYHENFGISAIEALAAGVPVVVSRQVQLAEFVTQHNLGRVVSASPAKLGSAIIEVLGNESLQTRARTQAPVIVARTFSPEVIGESLRKMYEGAILRTHRLPVVTE